MNIGVGELVRAFRGLGLEPGDVVLVHSSLSSIGHVRGGADVVVSALVQAVQPGGTMLFPLLTGRIEDGPDDPPTFDVRSSPCWTGAIPEAARLRPDLLRSLHPTHSVGAIGSLASWITRDHEHCMTPCGPGSPYCRLASAGGKILLLGVTHAANTCIHHVEEMASAPYVLQEAPVDCVVVNAQGREVCLRGVRLHSWEWPRAFNELEPGMDQLGLIRRGLVGKAECRVVDAAGMRKHLLRKLLEDPLITLAADVRDRFPATGIAVR